MNKRLVKTNLLTSILALLLFACASDAFGQINPEFVYHITARHSGKCLDVSGQAGENNAQVIQKDCSDAAESQKWRVLPVGDGTDYYKVIAVQGGRALDVNGGIFVFWNSAPVKLWDYYGGANQMWKFDPVGEDFFKIVAKHSGKSLDIDAGQGNDAIAQQWDYWAGDNQKFKLVPLTTGRVCPPDQIGSRLIGTSSLVVTRVSNNPFTQPANLTLDFTQCRGVVRLSRFEPTTTPQYLTPLGQNTTTVSLGAGGSGSISSTRNLSVQITLHLEQSLGQSPNPFIRSLSGPSDLTLTLTDTIAPDGNVTLTGSGRFVGGYLNGSIGNLKVTGWIMPSPLMRM